ncbi:DUF4446 family protein [Clostridium tyrobutyricum]|uniref:Uncharacterized protein n=1 Tax=Clostridium tyrobutyricum DIVETGP TaxID=1408889 RepID=W6N6M2_CLOTY|nr:DUF4446 family protein [Clostridium tyrobutyricum]AND86289.1 hypothetical protein CTK_C30510 [Clostridium tyrobutyricum]ANP70779.1 hypothetical protein BA182_14255 [Clostridium tyrobutyricum]MBR9649022.1 DUF4446 family protein [Clostridium tyrobutyricum]MBV4416917.1 DUF4446 family protein [Clostridium tyrobutyricum]MBV4423008.1 DUF4446 family protein [Clostridium tyrobutyricum]
MEYILKNIGNFQIYIMAVLFVLIIILFIIVAVLTKALNKVENKYRRLMRGVDNKNLEQLIIGYLDNIDEAKQETDFMKEKFEKLSQKYNTCVQKISIIRYRAFEDVGSDLSFSVAILDGNNSGVIITGIYGRSESTTYAKPIDKGMSRYELSNEENQVLQECINKKIDK